MKICITGGGTGGHLAVAEALANAAVENGLEVIFIGSTSGQDRDYFGSHNSFSHTYFLGTTGVVNQKGFAKIKALWRVFKAFFISRKLLKKHGIGATYSVGGFSAAPASFASISRGIPLFIHEQNAVEGRLNSILKPFCKRFISAYDEESPIKGYPVKEEFFHLAKVRDEIKTVIFLGGSLGAKSINDLALSVAVELRDLNIKIIHQTGKTDFQRVKKEYEKLGVEVELYDFTKEMPHLMSKADLAVSRSGASTLWELCANGLPALFIPYPHAASDHQYYNARFIVDNNMGWCQRESSDIKSLFISILHENLSEKSIALQEHSEKTVAQKMILDLISEEG